VEEAEEGVLEEAVAAATHKTRAANNKRIPGPAATPQTLPKVQMPREVPVSTLIIRVEDAAHSLIPCVGPAPVMCMDCFGAPEGAAVPCGCTWICRDCALWALCSTGYCTQCSAPIRDYVEE